MLIELLEKVSFAGHETFPFRYGWLKKGYEAVRVEPIFFLREDALVKLGTGKNMVRSIRHWTQAFQMIEEDSAPNETRGRALKPTILGQSLLDDEGWDPYLEDPNSLWLLHWLLVSNVKKATTWYLAFTCFHEATFSKDQLLTFITEKVNHIPSFSVAESSLGRDVDCFLRCYVPSRNKNSQLIEDTLDCPLVDLKLLEMMKGFDSYRFLVGPKPSLSAHHFGFACVTHFISRGRGRQTLSLDECVYGPGSPGQTFKLDPNSVTGYLEELERITNGAMTIDETAGLIQVYFRREINPIELLGAYYGRVARQ